MTLKYMLNICAVAALLSLGIAGPAAAQDKLVVSGSGGSLAVVLDDIYNKPFTAETGIVIESVPSSDRVSLLRAMFAAGKPTWDVSELASNEYARASVEGWLEKIDWARLDPNNMVDKADRRDYAVPDAYFSVVLVTADAKAPNGKTMTSWADFWDVEAFPGPRGMQNSALHNMEIALLADGVAREDVYATLATKEGVDRAFAKLDKIKPHINVWWTTGAQAPQALADGEVFYTSAFNGRISTLRRSGTPVTTSFNGALLKMGHFGIIKGSEHVDEAYKFLSYRIASPERAAQFANQSFYPPAVRGMIDFVDEDKKSEMPNFPANLENQLRFDEAFWLKYQDELSERWQAWMLE